MGFLQDGYNALARYYLNNFQDGIKQVFGQGLLSVGTSKLTVFTILLGYQLTVLKDF